MDFAARITRLPLPVDSARGQSALEATGIADPRLGDLIRGTAGCSPYLSGLILREADWLAEALQSRMDSLRAEAEKTASLLRLAEAEIKRADWGLTWNAALEGGGVLVSEKIDLVLDIQLLKVA